MHETIFDKIVRREVPAEIVYEDDETLAFLDIAPSNPGHVLVIPKKNVRNVLDADKDTWMSVMETVRTIAPGVMKAVGATGINVISNAEESSGQVVFHLHVHLIPRFENDGHKLFVNKKYEEDEMSVVAEKIRTELAS
ncbi:HIT family protein [Patescibacteria group bacterium]|nr:HIT family protein [Patescibacteria group bacterium]MBU0801762.1 HIT family protein [Alphaproteobacteria bacterium]MBU1754746.1 HIT family protein [Patescibacteria group bacterium]